MWVHLLSIVGLTLGAIGWWALQHASGGERLEKCTPGEGCKGCGSQAPGCGHPAEAPEAQGR